MALSKIQATGIIVAVILILSFNVQYQNNKRSMSLFVNGNNDRTTHIDGNGRFAPPPYLRFVENFSKKETATYKYKGIHILAAGRSGSSFLGEILAHHEQVFYMFEPGRLVDNWTKGPSIKDSLQRLREYIKMITSIYHCQFNNMELYLKALTSLSKNRQVYEIPAISSVDICQRNREKNCLITRELMQEMCINKKIVVIKTIRILDISNFLGLVNDADVNFNILHLIRDPRGRILSVLRTFHSSVIKKMKMRGRTVFDTQDLPFHIYTQLDNWCKSWIQNADIGQKSLASVYTAVRYEDISSMPLDVTSKLYQRLGLGKVSDQVAAWINDNTRSNKPGIYSVSRNSSLNAEKWRKSMTYRLAKRIQDMDNCGDFMDKFGYVKVANAEHILDLDVSLVKNFNTL